MGAIPFEPNQDGSTQGGELVYVGEVGTAFSRRMSTELRKLLEAIVAKKSAVNLKRNDAIFTVPLLFAEVEFALADAKGMRIRQGARRHPFHPHCPCTGSVRRAAPVRYCMFQIGKDAPS